MENLDEIDNFLDTYQVPKLKQDQINYLNSHINPGDLVAVLNSLPTKKRPGPDEFSGEFYQTFNEDLMPISLKQFHKKESERTHHSMKPQLHLYLNLKKNKQRKRTSGQFPL